MGSEGAPVASVEATEIVPEVPELGDEIDWGSSLLRGEAGGSLTTITRPTLNRLTEPARLNMSNHPEGKSRSISVRVLVLTDPPARVSPWSMATNISVGRCRFTVSKPVLKAPMVSALEATT